MHFQPRFSANKHTLISFVPLDNIKQRVNESFRQYMDRFVKTSLNIFFFSITTMYTSLMDLHWSCFLNSLFANPPKIWTNFASKNLLYYHRIES